MSNITENTIVIDPIELQEFKDEFDSFSEEFRMDWNGYIKLDNIVIVRFDCNGDNPWYMGRSIFRPMFNEINYLDGDGPITEMRDDSGNMYESNNSIKEWLSVVVHSREDLKIARDFIRYSDDN